MRIVILILVVMGPLKLILMPPENLNQLATQGQQKPMEKADKCQNSVESCRKILKTSRKAKDVSGKKEHGITEA